MVDVGDMSRLALALPMLLGSCAPHVRTYHVSTDFPAAEYHAIASAARQWNRACDATLVTVGGQVGRSFSYARDWIEPVERVVWLVNVQSYDYAAMVDDQGLEWEGLYGVYGGPIAIASSVPSAYIEHLALHEFGHALGLRVHTESGIMSARGSKQSCIDTESLVAICRLNDCGPRAAATCEE